MQVENKTDFVLSEESFSQVAKKVLSGENREREIVSLVFVGPLEIQELNKKFRGKDSPTDVLSFNLDEPEHLGEIVICPEVVKKQATEYGVPFQEELLRMYIHGILHLLGYDHEVSPEEEKRMMEKQEAYLSHFK